MYYTNTNQCWIENKYIQFGFPCLIELLAQLGALRHLNKLSLFKDITHQTVSMEEEYKNGDEDDPIVWIMRKLMVNYSYRYKILHEFNKNWEFETIFLFVDEN